MSMMPLNGFYIGTLLGLERSLSVQQKHINAQYNIIKVTSFHHKIKAKTCGQELKYTGCDMA